MTPPRAVTTAALATFFVVVQFYTSLAALSPTPPVGFVFAARPVAIVLVLSLVVSGAICAVALVRDPAPAPRVSLALLLAWIGAALVATLLGIDPLSGLQVVALMLVAAAFHLALVRYYPLPGVGRRILVAYLWAGTLAAGSALAMLAARIPAALFADNDGRAAGVFVTANQFAVFLVLFVFVALGVALAANGRLRVLAGAGVGTGLVALCATFSQGGALGAAAGAVFFAFASGARRVAALLLGVFVVAGLVVALRPVAGHDPSNAFDRLRTWQAGLRVAELFPLTGAGPMAYWRVYPDIRQPNGDLPGTFGALHPHDAYLSLAGETGAVGVSALVFGWWCLGSTIRSLLLRRPPKARLLALGVCAGLVGTLVQGIFDTIGIVQMTFVWIPYTALALATAGAGLPAEAA